MDNDGTTLRLRITTDAFASFTAKYIQRLEDNQSLEPHELTGELLPWLDNVKEAVEQALSFITKEDAAKLHSLLNAVLDKVEAIAGKHKLTLPDVVHNLPQIDDVLSALKLAKDGYIGASASGSPPSGKPVATSTTHDGRRDHWLEKVTTTEKRVVHFSHAVATMANAVGHAMQSILVIVVLLVLAVKALEAIGLG